MNLQMRYELETARLVEGQRIEKTIHPLALPELIAATA